MFFRFTGGAGFKCDPLQDEWKWTFKTPKCFDNGMTGGEGPKEDGNGGFGGGGQSHAGGGGSVLNKTVDKNLDLTFWYPLSIKLF